MSIHTSVFLTTFRCTNNIFLSTTFKPSNLLFSVSRRTNNPINDYIGLARQHWQWIYGCCTYVLFSTPVSIVQHNTTWDEYFAVVKEMMHYNIHMRVYCWSVLIRIIRKMRMELHLYIGRFCCRIYPSKFIHINFIMMIDTWSFYVKSPWVSKMLGLNLHIKSCC